MALEIQTDVVGGALLVQTFDPHMVVPPAVPFAPERVEVSSKMREETPIPLPDRAEESPLPSAARQEETIQEIVVMQGFVKVVAEKRARRGTRG